MVDICSKFRVAIELCYLHLRLIQYHAVIRHDHRDIWTRSSKLYCKNYEKLQCIEKLVELSNQWGIKQEKSSCVSVKLLNANTKGNTWKLEKEDGNRMKRIIRCLQYEDSEGKLELAKKSTNWEVQFWSIWKFFNANSSWMLPQQRQIKRWQPFCDFGFWRKSIVSATNVTYAQAKSMPFRIFSEIVFFQQIWARICWRGLTMMMFIFKRIFRFHLYMYAFVL